jgi:hypothetical protein
MPRASLNLAALRASRGGADPGTDAGSSYAMSRRRALGLAGVAVAGASPALRAVEGVVLGTFEVAESKGRVAFLTGGQECWVIDVRRFAGSPTLRVRREGGQVLVELRRARFPGTGLPADLSCRIWKTTTGWRLRLQMDLGGFDATGSFIPWLAGLETLHARVSLAAALPLATDTALTLAGPAAAAFAPHWQLDLEGRSVATLQALGTALPSNHLRLSLPTPDEGSLLSPTPAKRTLLALDRGNRAWQLQPDFPAAGFWQLQVPPNAFDHLLLELAEDGRGHPQAALVAEAGQSLRFVPHADFHTPAGAPVSLGLSGARYAVAFTPAGTRRSLVARFDPSGDWLQAGACAVEVGSTAGTPPFELHALGTAVSSVRCTPAVLRLSVPVPGAIAAPAAAVAGTHLTFVASGLAPASTPHAAQMVLSDHPTDAFARFTLINPRFAVVRPDDLLALTFEFMNMAIAVVKGKPPSVVPRSAKLQPYLAVHIQGQNIAEQAIYQVIPPPGPGNTGEFPEGQPFFPLGKRLADESRLVFALPSGFKSMPLTLEALLDWSQLTPSVPPTALPAGEFTKAPVAAPLSTETSLEIPWRLKISPNRYAGWLHSFTPVTHNGWTELWHTRLGVKVALPATKTTPAHTYLVDQQYAYEATQTANGKKYAVTRDFYAGGKPLDVLQGYRTIRAVWSPDYPNSGRLAENAPFRMSLTGQDRFDLVALTSFFGRAVPPRLTIKHVVVPKFAATSDVGPYNPLPVNVNRLMLSTLGAWVDLHGAWSLGYHLGIALEEWTHRGTQGRDNYVRVVYKGYLFPFGHRASLIKVTERKFFVQNGRNVAYLFQRMFLIVREPIKQFGNTGLTDPSGRSIDRAMPFKQVRITTVTTPDLDPPAKIDPVVGISSTDAFWPQIGKQDFLFHLVAQDSDGQQTEFTAPLAFISVEGYLAFQHDPLLVVRNHYEHDGGLYPSRRTRPTNGAKVAFAPSNKPGDTTLHAASITFDAFVPLQGTHLADDQPRFFPVVAASAVAIPALEALLRTGQQPSIRLSDHFLISGMGGANAGEVFAEVLDAVKPKVSFGGGNSGGTGTPGVVTPNLAVNGLSRVMGPVGGDLTQLAQGNVPDVGAFLTSFFDNDAKILGAIPLSSIIKLPDLGPIFKVLSLVQAVEQAPDSLTALVDQAVAALTGNLATLTTQARAALQTELAPVRAELAALQTPLNTLHAALSSLPSIVTDLLGDVGTIVTDLNKLVTDLSTLITRLDTLLADLGAGNLGALNGDAAALQSGLTAFPTDLGTLVHDLSTLQGINPLPAMKHAQLPTAIDTTLNWSPHLQSSPPFTALDKFLAVTATIHVPLDGSAPSFSILGTLGKFSMDIAGVIRVGFGGLSFSVKNGQKPDVTAGGVEVLFEGPLAFVNDLKDVIPSSGFTDPPFVDVTADHLEAGFTLDLPSIGVGIFSLENVSLGAKVMVPFIGSSPAQVYFNFCTREHPFILTVSLLGGGGFFGITLGLDGLDMLEASLEFGAELSLDFGIASGSVSIMAGIYFKIEKSPKDDAILTAFVHIHGEVEALAILSVSIDVELDLTYEKDGMDTKLVGTATLTISVHVLFFSVTVSASVHREFAGSHNDPSFADQVSQQQWTDYLKAFA